MAQLLSSEREVVMSHRDVAEKLRHLRVAHPSGEVGTVIEAIMIQEEQIARLENDISKLKSEILQLKNQAAKRY